MPAEGIKMIPHEDILSYEEIFQFVKVAVKSGVNKVRLTGGEPLVRMGIVDLVSMLSSIEGLDDLSMTTNGVLLAKYAEDLAYAGLQRVNISLDSLDKGNYQYITRIGKLDTVLSGILAAKEAGMSPIKINCVIKDSSDELDAQEIRKFGRRHGLMVRYIREMNLERGSFSEVEGGDGGKCHICNRLRLTANGFLKPCLFSEHGYNIRDLGYEQALQMAVHLKPKKGSLNNSNSFYNIGG
jgi:cyclic pyranopterin phosphate synthase